MAEPAAPDAPSPAPSPAPAPGPAPSPAPAAPAPLGTLFQTTPPVPAPSAAPPAAPILTDAPAWIPEKYRVAGADGKIDFEASGAKMSAGLAAAVQRIGTGEIPPASPDDYKFTPPEAFKDIPVDEAASKSFREKAHKAGFTQAQYELFMQEYYELVPSVLDAAATVSAETARAELQKVWATPAELNANMSNAERAVALAPQALRDQLRQKYGTDPLFWQFAAHYGKQLREDSPPAGAAPAAQSTDVEALMKSPAYRDTKHPDHAAVSARVVAIQKARFGEAAISG